MTARPMRLDVLYEDNHLLVVAKPAGIPTQGVSVEGTSVVTLARQYLKQKYHKPGNVYVGVVSRLDAPVSGVLVLARTSKSARRLNEQFRGRTVQKRYWAVVEGANIPPEGELVDWLQRDDARRRTQIVKPGAASAKEARLLYRRLETVRGLSLVEVELQTGRKHQIRTQLAHRGWPVVGDERYGSRRRFDEGIALHARSLELFHPTKGGRLRFVAPLPASWVSLGIREPLPGDPST
jgi:23S rRNA pseudouridine1911/1915/1917 synthase